MLPVIRAARNEMILGVFILLFIPRFLWNSGIGRTIPNRKSCKCLELINPLAAQTLPSCPSSPSTGNHVSIGPQTHWGSAETAPVWPCDFNYSYLEYPNIYRNMEVKLQVAPSGEIPDRFDPSNDICWCSLVDLLPCCHVTCYSLGFFFFFFFK